MSEFPQASFMTSADHPRQFVEDSGAEVAFVGRSNAGKSTAINAIVNRRNFARVSKQPGRTQLVNFFSLGDDQRLVDLPGYGFAKVSHAMRDHWRELLSGYFESRHSLSGTMIVVDSRRLLGEFDLQMIEWCASIECPVHILLSKADKLKRQQATRALLQVRRELGDRASVQLFSGTKGQGVTEARACLQALLIGAPLPDLQ